MCALHSHSILDHDGTPWRDRLAVIVDTMREISRQTDPQAMVRFYASRMREFMPTDVSISLSRRGLTAPEFLITRFSGWTEAVNPWLEPHRLPRLSGGLLADLIYGDEPRLIEHLSIDDSDPARDYLKDVRALSAIPLYDAGVATNMVIQGLRAPNTFNPEVFPEIVWLSNLFGRATHNLVLRDQLHETYVTLERELQTVADIQQSLLPGQLPRIPGLDLAAHYQTSQRAGGDYYDLFPLPDGRWGMLIADVSGHGTPAAVVMAIAHAITHTHPGPPRPPGNVLGYINQHLTIRYTTSSGSFVTAFYGVYDPVGRTLTFANAGHPPPRLKRCAGGTIAAIEGSSGLPLGILFDEDYAENTIQLVPGDQIVLYTDGITEAMSPSGEMLGIQGLDAALGKCREDAASLIAAVLTEVQRFTADRPADDDRTMIVAKVR